MSVCAVIVYFSMSNSPYFGLQVMSSYGAGLDRVWQALLESKSHRQNVAAITSVQSTN